MSELDTKVERALRLVRPLKRVLSKERCTGKVTGTEGGEFVMFLTFETVQVNILVQNFHNIMSVSSQIAPLYCIIPHDNLPSHLVTPPKDPPSAYDILFNCFVV